MNCTRNPPSARYCECAIAAFYADTEGVMPMATGCSLKAPIDPERVPLPPIEPPSDTTGRLIDLGRWAALTVVVMAASAATVAFFTKG